MIDGLRCTVHPLARSRREPITWLREPAVEERAGGWDRERARGARPSVSEARQPQALPVGDHRGHLRGVVVLVLQLPGDEERRDGERPERLVRDPFGPQLRRAARRAAPLDRLGG